MKNEEQSGFFNLPENEVLCKHPEHNPPTHIYIPEGKGYKHVCPYCGHVAVLIPNKPTF